MYLFVIFISKNKNKVQEFYMKYPKDLSGLKFGRLTAQYPTEKRCGTSVV